MYFYQLLLRLFFCFGIISTAFVSCLNNDVTISNKKIKDTTNFTTIKWIDSLKDIGSIPPGKNAEINFLFLNTGDKPLYIINAKPGCGCTIADYPKSPIMPGKEGVIKANYAVHKDGQGDFRKYIRVTTNTKGSTETYIYFYGTIMGDSVNTNIKIAH